MTVLSNLLAFYELAVDSYRTRMILLRRVKCCEKRKLDRQRERGKPVELVCSRSFVCVCICEYKHQLRNYFYERIKQMAVAEVAMVISTKKLIEIDVK